MKILNGINFTGLLVLSGLCFQQWNKEITYRDQIIDRNEQVIALKDNVAKLETEKEKQKEIISEFRKNVTELKATLEKRENKIEALTAKVNSLEGMNAQLKKAVEEWAEAVRKRDQELQRAVEIDKEKNAQIDQLVEVNKELKNANLPDQIRIGAVLRDKKVIIPKSNFIFQNDDKVVLIVKKDTIPVVENLFRLSSV